MTNHTDVHTGGLTDEGVETYLPSIDVDTDLLRAADEVFNSIINTYQPRIDLPGIAPYELAFWDTVMGLKEPTYVDMNYTSESVTTYEIMKNAFTTLPNWPEIRSAVWAVMALRTSEVTRAWGQEYFEKVYGCELVDPMLEHLVEPCTHFIGCEYPDAFRRLATRAFTMMLAQREYDLPYTALGVRLNHERTPYICKIFPTTYVGGRTSSLSSMDLCVLKLS